MFEHRACITSNCGNLSFYFCEKREYDHPFIACLFVIDEFYVKLCENFDYYMTVTPKFAQPSQDSIWAKQNDSVWYKHKEIQKGYPVMYLDDIEIHWIHEDNIEELITKYNRRRERYLSNKPETIFFWSDGDMMNDHEPQKYNELISRFSSLHNSVFITRHEKIAKFYKNSYVLSDWINAPVERNDSHVPLIHVISDRVAMFKNTYANYSSTKYISNVKQRDYIHISNNYFLNSKNGDFTCNIFYVNQHECCVSIIRHDEDSGWNNQLEITIDNELFSIPPCRESFMRIFLITKTELTSVENISQLIPKIIVQTNESHEYKNQYDFLAQNSVLEANPEYEYVYFNNMKRRAFLRENFDDDVIRAYDMLVAGAFQADIFRIAYLFKKGGCYLDFKVIARTSLRDIIQHDDDLIMCCDYDKNNSMDRKTCMSYLNSVIFTEPNSEKMCRVLQACVNNILNNRHYFEVEMLSGRYNKILSMTGPCLLYEVLQNELNDKQLRLKHVITNNDETQYENFKIVSLETQKCIFTKTHRTYAYSNRYDELWSRNEIFFTNISQVGEFFVYVYPHRFNDEFSFYVTNDKQLCIFRKQKEGWGMNLKLKIVNDITSHEEHIIVGHNSNYLKIVNINLFQSNEKPNNVFHENEFSQQKFCIKKEVICVPSVICILDIPLDGVEKRSVLSHQERFEQTITQLLSIKALKRDDVTVILAECSNLPKEYMQKLSELCDYIFIYDSQESFSLCHDNFHNKGLGEIHMIRNTINVLSEYDFEHFYKFGGRYTLMKDFNLLDHKRDVPTAKIIHGPYTNIMTQNGLMERCVSHTVFYTLPKEYAINYARFLSVLLKQQTNYTAEHILTLFLSSLNRMYNIKMLNVTGCIATNGEHVIL
jgi:uncharacterized protein (DUF1919 family)